MEFPQEDFLTIRVYGKKSFTIKGFHKKKGLPYKSRFIENGFFN